MLLHILCRRLRGERKVLLQSVADAVGISREQAYDFERGRFSLSASQVSLLSEFYSVPLSLDSGKNIILHNVDQALEFLLVTRLHIDPSTHAGEHLMHYIEMAEDRLKSIVSLASE